MNVEQKTILYFDDARNCLTSAWKGGYTMPFILQMLQTLLARFPKTLKKSCQESKNCNSIMARAMLTSPQKCITLRKVSLSLL